jgi:hypothetical protein
VCSRCAPDSTTLRAALEALAAVLAARADHGVALLGPLPPDSGWQARDEEGFDLARFGIDWEQRQVTCPNGKTARNWRQGTSRHGLPVRVDAWLTGTPLGDSWGLSPHQTPTNTSTCVNSPAESLRGEVHCVA